MPCPKRLLAGLDLSAVNHAGKHLPSEVPSPFLPPLGDLDPGDAEGSHHFFHASVGDPDLGDAEDAHFSRFHPP